MLLVRYFVCVGGTLLGLLLLADWYFPASTATTAIVDTGIDRSTIRIHTSHKWPSAVQIDTSAPMPVVPAAAPVVAETTPPNPPAPHVREAYALAPPPPKEPEKIHRRARTARPLPREHTQRFANYQPPDSRGWPPAGW